MVPLVPTDSMRSLRRLLLPLLLLAVPVLGDELAETEQELFDRAISAAEQGDLAGAIELLAPLRGRPDAPEALVALLGTLYLETGQAAEALAVLRPLAEADDADAAVLYNTSRAAAGVGRFELAERYLDRAAALQPVSPAARDLGMVRGRQGRVAEAYRLLRPWALEVAADHEARGAAAHWALELDRPREAAELLEGLPLEAPAIALVAARLRLVEGEPDAALELLEPLVVGEPGPARRQARRLAAEAALAANLPGRAAEVLAGEPADDPEVVLLQARAQVAMGEPDRAARVLRPLAEAAPASPGDIDSPRRQVALARILGLFGELLLDAGRAAAALERLERAVALDPTDAAVWRNLARAYEATGREREEAVARATAAAMEDPDTYRIGPDLSAPGEPPAITAERLSEALRWLERGRFEEALRRAEQEVVLAPDDLRPRFVRTRILIEMERYEDAMASAEEVLELLPDHPNAYYQRAIARIGLRQLEDAESDLRQVLESWPDHTGALTELAIVLAVQGEREEARRMLERVLALSPGDIRAAANLRRLDAGEVGRIEP